MRIAVASGKGGTGKTTVALALAECAGAVLADCDVEEPNCHLFSDAPLRSTKPVTVRIPEFTGDACTGCGACSRVCRFHALARLGKRVLVFPELCHSCGGCVLACPTHSLKESDHEIGAIEERQDPRFRLVTGVMKVGHSMAPPVISQVKEYLKEEPLVILDSPPGTACAMVTAVTDADYVILVTEPTPFGLHDLTLAVDTLKMMKLPHGVILNRATGTEDDRLIEDYCQKERVPLLMKIPFSRQIAAGYSQGKSLLESAPELKPELKRVLESLGGGK